MKYLYYSLAFLNIACGLFGAITQTPTTILVQTMNYMVIGLLFWGLGNNERKKGGKQS